MYNFFSATHPNFIEPLKHLLITLKMYKRKDAQYNYIIAIEDDKIEYYKKYFDFLKSDDFNILVYSANVYRKRVNPPKNDFIYYVRCLLPSVCSDLDKILYLDCDMVVLQEGILKFYDQDMSKYYVAACWDFLNDNPYDVLKKMAQTKTYFNSGVILFNIKKIKEDGIDKKMEQYLLKWPEEVKTRLHDQTLDNYVFKDKVAFCSPIYNNCVFYSYNLCYKIFYDFYKALGYLEPIYSLKDTVILHFAGPKPWIRLSETLKKDKTYFNEMMTFYKEIRKKILDFELFLLSKE